MKKIKLVLGQSPYKSDQKLKEIPDGYPFKQVAFIPAKNKTYNTFSEILKIINECNISIDSYNGVDLAKKFTKKNVYFANRSEIIQVPDEAEPHAVGYPDLKRFLDNYSEYSVHIYIIGKCKQDYALFELLNKCHNVTYSVYPHPRERGNTYHLA